MMTVAELKEALDEFGDHLTVIVRQDSGDVAPVWSEFTVDYGTSDGDGYVIIDV